MDDGSSTPPPKLPPSETQSRRSMGGSSTSTPPQLPPNSNDLQQEVKSMQGLNPELVTEYWSKRLGKPVAVGHRPGNKASKIRATSISIGPDCRKESIRAKDLMLKLSFAKKKLIWEFLEGPLKEKIVVSWSDITAIHAHIPDHQPGLLQIQLGSSSTPSFFRKTPPERKWIKTSDFTHANAASRHRIHEAKFRQGVLEEHYAKLMLSDQRLLELSMHPFPAYPTPTPTQQGESSSTAPCLQQQSLTTVNNPTPSTAMQGESSSSSSRNAEPLVLPSYQNEPLPEELYHEFFNIVNPAANVDQLQLTMDMENTSAHDHPINSLPNTLEGSNIDAGVGDHQCG